MKLYEERNCNNSIYNRVKFNTLFSKTLTCIKDNDGFGIKSIVLLDMVILLKDEKDIQK